jgi:hypothetical protein
MCHGCYIHDIIYIYVVHALYICTYMYCGICPKQRGKEEEEEEDREEFI